MKKKPNSKQLKTYVAFVLDKSSSMEATKKSAVDNFNEYVDQMVSNSNEGQQIYCSLVSFNHDVFEHLWNEPAEKLTKATVEGFQPSGCTALRDAVGYTIRKLQATTDEKDPNVAYLVVVISDGEENSSKHFSAPALKEVVEGCDKADNWTFTYLGCSEAYLKEVAAQTGLKVSSMMSWNASNMATVRAVASKGSADYFTARRSGLKKTDEFYEGFSGYSGYSGAKGTGGPAFDLNSLTSDQLCSLQGAKVQASVTVNCVSDLFGSGTVADWNTYSANM